MHTDIIYVCAIQKASGTLLIDLGLMELLHANYSRIGFFKPVIEDKERGDEDIHFMHKHFKLKQEPNQMSLFDLSDIKRFLAHSKERELYEAIVAHIKAQEENFDIIICSGLSQEDLAFVGFDLNLEIASNLNAFYLPVMSGKGRTLAEIKEESTALLYQYEKIYEGTTLACIVNRLEPELLSKLKKEPQERLFFIPEEQELALPTIYDLKTALDCKVLVGKEDDFKRVIKGIKVGSMEIEHFVEHIEEGDLVVLSGDRADLILASIASMYSKFFPHVSGLLLTGNLVPSKALLHLLEGLSYFSIPILLLPYDTYTTLMRVEQVRSKIRPHSERKIALAMGLFSRYVPMEPLLEQLSHNRSDIVTPINFEYRLMQRARRDKKRIVLPESTDERILRAAEIVLRRGVVDITLLGEPETIEKISKNLGLDLSKATIVNPKTDAKLSSYIEHFYKLRKQKGLSYDAAKDALAHENYFATMMVALGDADGMVSGAIHTTSDTIRPALQIIKTKPGISIVSSCFFMCMKSEVLVYADCAINQNPDAVELSEIARSSAHTAKQFGIEPKVAMLSYSTGNSGHGDEVEKVKQATALAQAAAPELLIEGPIQYDAAIDKKVAQKKMPHSKVAGHATVFIFPDLNTGNNTYKAVQRSSKAVAIGPILQGLNKPVNDLSRGCLVADIINTIAVTAIQAQEL